MKQKKRKVMGIKAKTAKIKGGFPVFWSRCSTLPGDFKVTNVPADVIIPKGTPIKLDFDRMECKVCRAIEVTGGTTTKPQIKKGSFITTSDTVGEQTISSIDTSNADYDELTLAAAEASATKGAIIAIDEDLPDAVVERTIKHETDQTFNTVSAGYDVVILKAVAYPIPADWLTGFSMKNNPSIKYIKQ